jgi:hypothetical protein
VNGRYYNTNITYNNYSVYIKENKRCVLYFDGTCWKLSFNQKENIDFYKSSGTSITGTWIKDTYGKDNVPIIRSINQKSNYSFSDKPNDGKTYKYKIFNHDNFLSGIDGYYYESKNESGSDAETVYLYYKHDSKFQLGSCLGCGVCHIREGFNDFGDIVYDAINEIDWHESLDDWEDKDSNSPGMKGAYYDLSLLYPYKYMEDKDLEEYVEVPTKSIDVIKIWEDDNNKLNLRPASISIKLLQNGTQIRTASISNSSNWQHKFINLPECNSDFTPYTYTIDESTVPPNYQKSINEYTITNRLTKPLIDFTANIIWQDDFNNKNNTRPLSVTIKLLQNNTYYSEAIVSLPEQSYTWNDLDEFDEYGNKFVYSIEHHEVDDYASSLNSSTNSITYSYIKPKIDYTITKIWNDQNNALNSRPENYTLYLLKNNEIFKEAILDSNITTYTWTNLEKYDNSGNEIIYSPDELDVENYEKIINDSTITNNLIASKIDILIKAIWNDKNNLFNCRPDKIQVNVLSNDIIYQLIELNESNNWQLNLSVPDYDELTFEKINYSIELISSVENYDSKINGLNIENTFIIPCIDYSINKIWDDENNKFNTRPKLIKVQLLKDGNIVQNENINLSDDINWKYTWKNLPKYDENDGHEIIYSIDEIDEIQNYIKLINGNVITNKFVIPKFNYTCKIIWKDKDNLFKHRPSQASIILMANGNTYGDIVIVSENTNWEYTWHDLPEYDKNTGEKYSFSIDEVTPYNYSKIINGNIITNEFVMPVVEYTVTKEWFDFNNKFKSRPNSIFAILLDNSNKQVNEIAEISPDTKWKYTWKNLPKYDETTGELIVYKVDEVQTPPHYTKIIENNKIINKWISPLLTGFTITKIWDDQDNANNLRPDYIEVQLYADGFPLNDIIQITKNQNWKYEVTGVPEYNETTGEKINYTFNEIRTPENYIKTINLEERTITNRCSIRNVSLNGFSIISFNTDIDLSSIKYENYEFENDDVTKVDSYNLNRSNMIKSFSINKNDNDTSTNYIGLEKYWIIINENNPSNLIIVKNQYLDNFDNFFGGPFDSQEELLQFLNNFTGYDYTITLQQ